MSAPNAEYERPHWRLYCRVIGHHWLPMTGETMWAPITCGRCGFVVTTPNDGSRAAS